MLNIKNNSKTTLSSEITSDATEMTVANASLLPDVPCRVTIDNEILEITAKNGNICSISRGKEGTTPSVHSANSEVRANITVGVFNDIKAPYLPLCTYGETIAVNDALYLKTSDGKVYKTDADFNDERIYNFIGFAKEAGNANDVKNVQTAGVVEGFSGLSTGGTYYLSGTAGSISLTPATYRYSCGLAVSSTQLFILMGGDKMVIPSNTLRWSNDTEVYSIVLYPTKFKEIKVGRLYLDSIRISFDYALYNGYTAKARVYKNGSPMGIEYSSGSSSYQTATQDLGPFQKDDLIQIYAGGTGSGSGCKIRNFRLYYDEVLLTKIDFTNQNP